MKTPLPAGGGDPGAIDALYIHTPFCFHKCHYCDFYSIVDNADDPGTRHGPFVDALIAEITHQAAAFDLRPRTIFVGGGTPTLLEAPHWRRILDTVRGLGILDRVEEFTVEANPETVTPELARTLAAGGVNRVSIGAQSFQPPLLKALERWHDPANVGRAIATFREAGITNINLDLIFGIPGQTLADLDADLDAALALEPAHLSYYGLTYEPNTPMAVKLRLGRIDAVEEDLEAQMYERLLDRLDDAGFEQYEISNWAKKRPESSVSSPKSANQEQEATPGSGPGTLDSLRCRHNLAYWHNLNWLGVGPSASSHVAGRRWKNQAHLGRYIAASPQPPIVDEETLPPERRTGEALMLGLRLREGVTLDWLRQAVPTGDPRWASMDEFVGLGLLERTPDRLRLTRRGLLVADALIARLL